MAKSTAKEMAPSPYPSTKVIFNSLPSRKRLLSSSHFNSQKSPSSPPPTIQSRKPDISKCHSCNSQQIGSSRGGGKCNNYKLQLLDSKWRIVLLCNSCFDAVQSAKNCSYCFLGISELVYSCWNCGRRVHKSCVSNYSGLSCCSNADSFTCIDCWVPSRRVSACCSSRSSSPNSEGFKMGLGSCSSRCLEDVVKDASLTAERKVSAALRARDDASKKAVVARKAASKAAIALGSLRVDCGNQVGVSDLLLGNLRVVDDEVELKSRLCHVINNSPRIFKNMHLGNSDPLVVLKKLNVDDSLVYSKSDHGKRSSLYQQFDVCNVYQRMTKKQKNAMSKPSACIHASDCCSFKLSVFERRAKGNSSEISQEKKCEENVVVEDFESETEASLPQAVDCKDAILELHVEEEQSNSSDKLDEFSRSNNDINSGSHGDEEWKDLEKVLLNSQKEKWYKPYCKYVLKYSMRHKILKDAIPEHIAEEEQLNSSNQLDEFCTSNIGINSGSHGHEEIKGLDRVILNDQEEKWNKPDYKYLLKYSKRHKISKAVPVSCRTCSQSSCDKDLFEPKEETCDGHDKYLYKYTKRQRNF